MAVDLIWNGIRNQKHFFFKKKKQQNNFNFNEIRMKMDVDNSHEILRDDPIEVMKNKSINFCFIVFYWAIRSVSPSDIRWNVQFELRSL